MAVGPGESSETTGIWIISIIGNAPKKLRDDAGRAAVSPDDARIAYVSGRSESEIWVMDSDGGNPKKLLGGAAGDRFLQLQWSPIGDRIAFLKSHSEAETAETAIETLPLTGGSSRAVLSAPGLRSFCWTPDGRFIYSMAEPGANSNDMNLWEFRISQSGERESDPPRRITSWAGISSSDLSVSADGKHLVFVNAGLQSNIYVAPLAGRAGLGNPQPLTFEGRNNLPTAWTPDGKEILFQSDRNGNWNIFLQRVPSLHAQDFLVGPGQQTSPIVTSDASHVLYWNTIPANSQATASQRLLRVPMAGGPPEPVLVAGLGAAVRCARDQSTCVLSEMDSKSGELIFSAFDPLQGTKHELLRVATNLDAPHQWDLSPNGKALAIVGLDEHENSIREVTLENNSARSFSVGPAVRISGISWAADGNEWFVTSSSVRGSTLFEVNLSGAVSKLWTSVSVLGSPLASPDGKNVAFSVRMYDSNAWMLENF